MPVRRGGSFGVPRTVRASDRQQLLQPSDLCIEVRLVLPQGGDLAASFLEQAVLGDQFEPLNRDFAVPIIPLLRLLAGQLLQHLQAAGSKESAGTHPGSTPDPTTCALLPQPQHPTTHAMVFGVEEHGST